MGTESYFITVTKIIDEEIIIENKKKLNEKENIYLDDFKKILKQKKIRLKAIETKYSKWYAINDMLKMTIHFENNYITGFTFECCFSWYEETIQFVSTLIELINNELLCLKIIKPFEFFIEPFTAELIKNKIKEYNKDRYQYFNEIFSGIRFKSLPDRMFYKKLPMQKIYTRIFRGSINRFKKYPDQDR
jgi:hypothetical protein